MVSVRGHCSGEDDVSYSRNNQIMMTTTVLEIDAPAISGYPYTNAVRLDPLYGSESARDC